MKHYLIQFKFFRKYFKGKYYKISCTQLSMGSFWSDTEITSCQSRTIAIEEYYTDEYRIMELLTKGGENKYRVESRSLNFWNGNLSWHQYTGSASLHEAKIKMIDFIHSDKDKYNNQIQKQKRIS